MTLKQCLLVANDCYKSNLKMTGNKPVGIVVHSTGANNKNLKRYVQPLKTDSNRATIIADIGTNLLGNHWNKSGLAKCVHAFIGVNNAGVVETYQTLPFDVCCWGVGKGSKGSYNYNPTAKVQFEICEDNLKDKKYFDAVFKEAAEFCAHICKKYKLSVDTITSHQESYQKGYGSNHGDCDHWLKKFDKDMNWFRAEVDKILNPKPKTESVQTSTTSTATKITTGAKLTLNKVALYSAATSTKAATTKTGTFYVWDKEAINNRIRITNKESNVGKLGKVTGWVNCADVTDSVIPYKVKITASTLNVRKGGSTKYAILRTVKKNTTHTIVKEQNGWGELETGGWISLSYTKKV